MTTAELVNRIIEKLGGNRIEFLEIELMEHNRLTFSLCKFEYSGNIFEARVHEDAKAITVKQEFLDQGPLDKNRITEWIEGVLNGKTRNEEGVLS